jgi:tetratricopeptide (TPR) repeat protein
LHMPSHIFTRLGLWQDSIDANTAARSAARHAGDVGEELHDMDYLAYAYLQLGQDADAAQVVSQLRSMSDFDSTDFKSAYAATAIPIRYIVERADWSAATEITASPEAPPEVAAASYWAQGLGLARTGRSAETRQPVQALERLEQQLHSDHNEYWATQVRVMRREVFAWAAHAQANDNEAAALLRQASDEEDSLEKLPVTPGPIIPAREQLGTLLLEQGHPNLAIAEFKRALAAEPGRRGSITGLELATQRARKQ